MDYMVFAVYDKKTQEFGLPWYAKNEPSAMRQFANEVNRVSESNVINTNPEDFALFHLGIFNADTGNITNTEQNVPVLLLEATKAFHLSDARKER